MLYSICGYRHFNPRSPRGERHYGCFRFTLSLLFQSTLPAGGATNIQKAVEEAQKISIHAPRGGSDLITGYELMES